MKKNYRSFPFLGGLLCSLAANSFMYASNTHSKDLTNTESLSNFSSSMPKVEFFDKETKEEILRQFRESGKPNVPKSYEYPERIITNKKGEKILLEG